MKRFFIILPLLGACSFQARTAPEPLQPLSTTGKSGYEVVDDRTLPERRTSFVANVRNQHKGPVPMTDNEMLMEGQFWCDARSSGLSDGELMDFARATATSEQDRQFTLAIIANAILDLCN